jgi:hypothetical protein
MKMKKRNAEILGIMLGGMILFALALTIGPFLLIWGVNTLAGLAIQFTFWNWLAALAIIAVLRGGK